VATVAIGGAANAGLLAARILAVADDGLLKKLEDYAAAMEAQVKAKDERLQEKGFRGYAQDE
jgi:5-(carboxyamino)imidazole ribonucleotide mutase